MSDLTPESEALLTETTRGHTIVTRDRLIAIEAASRAAAEADADALAAALRLDGHGESDGRDGCRGPVTIGR